MRGERGGHTQLAALKAVGRARGELRVPCDFGRETSRRSKRSAGQGCGARSPYPRQNERRALLPTVATTSGRTGWPAGGDEQVRRETRVETPIRVQFARAWEADTGS